MSLNIVEFDKSVGIICPDVENKLYSFIDIYVNQEPIKSPLKDIESARMFAEILVKLLEAVHDFE